ncbi:MFS transporter [Paraburkholderia sp. Ac-20342]|uniref:MFS transporter n=1 Tax=Paraburkholderia sp. Ac-20342 TaxID=2703889 RepID=UPI001980DB14|nr:MFS transporter [Paraburkholderia sp. Ac-20342]MBN3849609.1 MFS transporter [Paraburkholderia sp. Ac-20342]
MSGDKTSVQPSQNKVIIFVVAVSFFMENLDGTILSTALPQIARSFGVAATSLSVLMSVYMLTLAVCIPVSGWIADRWEPRHVFAAAVGLFSVSSALCGLCWSVQSLMMARILQGMAGAAMVPVGRLIVLRVSRKEELLKVLNTVTMPGLVAPILGPPLGGFITTYLGWRGIFIINVPFGIVGLLYTLRCVPSFCTRQRRPFDWTGFLMGGGALTCILAGAEYAGSADTLTTGLTLIGAGVFLGLATARHSTRVRYPLTDFSVFRIPTFSVTVLTGSVTRVSIGALPFVMPLLLQAGLGFSAFKAGLLFLASAVGTLGTKSVVLKIVRRFGFRRTMSCNSLIVGFMYCVCCLIRPGIPEWVIGMILFGCGVARSVQFTCLNTIAFADIGTEAMNSASTLYSTFQQAAMALGIAFGAVAMQWAIASSGLANHYSMHNFRVVFFAMALVAAISSIGYIRMDSRAGSTLSAQAAVAHSKP